MGESLGLGKIVQIAIGVQDMDRAVAFYRDVVALKFMFQAPNVAFFDCAGIRLMLGQAAPTDPKPSGMYLYFDSADIDRDHAALAERGAVVRTAPHVVAPLGGKQLWLAEFGDTEGNTFCLMQLK